jgi:hypothetical protein
LTSQTAAATSASSAATSASSALTSANSAATSYDDFDDRYLGAKATPPTVDNDGNALLTGALYWNTSVNKMYVWSGTAWGEISSSAEMIAYKYTVTGGATSVSGADDNGLTLTYTVGKEQVYINGVLQVRGSDYTATTGSSITGMAALTASDIVTVLAFTAFSISNTYTQAEADARFVQNTGNFSAGKNKIINGDFAINQRNFTTDSVGGYGFDRFIVAFSGGAGTATAQTFTPGTAPVAGYEGKNFLRVAVSSGNDYFRVVQSIESVRTFAGQTATLSFWAKGTNPTTAGSLKTSIVQNFGSGGSPSTQVRSAEQSIVLTANWTRYSFTFAVPSIAGKTFGTDNNDRLEVEIGQISNTSTESWTLDLWGVQFEAGSIATAFQTATGSIQGELAACKRYFRKTYNITVAPGTAAAAGYQYSNLTSVANNSIYNGYLIEGMRTAPTIVVYGYNGTAGTVSEASNGVDKAANSGIATDITSEAFLIRNGNASTQTFTQGAIYHFTANAEL